MAQRVVVGQLCHIPKSLGDNWQALTPTDFGLHHQLFGPFNGICQLEPFGAAPDPAASHFDAALPNTAALPLVHDEGAGDDSVGAV